MAVEGPAPKVRRLLRDLVNSVKVGSGLSSKARLGREMVQLRRLPVQLTSASTSPPTRQVWMKPGTRLVYRPGEPGDLQSIREVWLEEVYRPPVSIGPIDVVVDCGAHIGLSSLWFAQHLRPRQVVSVEPSPGNARLLRQNLAHNGVTARVIEAAVGPASGHSSFEAGGGTNLGRLSVSGGVQVPVVEMADILKDLAADRIDLLKIDIEGGERGLLSDRLAWLTRVRNVVFEVHRSVVSEEWLGHQLAPYGFRAVPRSLIHDSEIAWFVTDPARIPRPMSP